MFMAGIIFIKVCWILVQKSRNSEGFICNTTLERKEGEVGDEELKNHNGVRGPDGKANLLQNSPYSLLFQPGTIVPCYLVYACLKKKKKLKILYLLLSICENPKLKDV